jgi:hypothetical protein
VKVLNWADARDQKAKRSVPSQTFDCGRPGKAFLETPPEAYDMVRVYVSATGEATQIISGVRERLRMLNGTEVVYSPEEADLSVSLIAMNVKNIGDYQSGVAIAVGTTAPCVLKRGTDTTKYDVLMDDFLQIGADRPTVINEIVSSIDTNSLDNQRKINAQYENLLKSMSSQSAK